MEISVDLSLVVFALVGALAGTCGLIYLALRNNSALGWLAATMTCVGTEALVLRYAAGSLLGNAALALLIPSAYLCASQAIRLSMGLAVTNARLIAILAAFIAISLPILVLDVHPFVQFLPFQLAGAIVFLDTVIHLARQRSRPFLGNAILILCWCSMVGVAIRMPMFPTLLGDPTPFPIMETEAFQQVFVFGLGALSAGLAVLVVVSIVANEIPPRRKSPRPAEADHHLAAFGRMPRMLFQVQLAGALRGGRELGHPGFRVRPDLHIHWRCARRIYRYVAG